MNFTLEGALGELEKDRDNLEAERDELKRKIQQLEAKVQTLESEKRALALKNESLALEKETLEMEKERLSTKKTVTKIESRVDSTTREMNEMNGVTKCTPASPHDQSCENPIQASDASRNDESVGASEINLPSANVDVDLAASAPDRGQQQQLQQEQEQQLPPPQQQKPPPPPDVSDPHLPVADSEETSQKSDRNSIDMVGRQSVVKLLRRFLTDMKIVEKEMGEIQRMLGGKREEETRLDSEADALKNADASDNVDASDDAKTPDNVDASSEAKPANNVDVSDHANTTENIDAYSNAKPPDNMETSDAGEMAPMPDGAERDAVSTKLEETRAKFSASLAKFKNKMKSTLKTRKDD